MQQATKLRALGFAAPLLRGIGLVGAGVYKILFAWWIDPWLQRRANRALLDDVYANFHFLISQDKSEVSSPAGVQSFGCASVEILWSNLKLNITRGRGDVSISVAPRHAPEKSYEFGPVIAVLDRRNFSSSDVINDLSGAADILRRRLEALNAAFSEQDFPSIEQRL